MIDSVGSTHIADLIAFQMYGWPILVIDHAEADLEGHIGHKLCQIVSFV